MSTADDAGHSSIVYTAGDEERSSLIQIVGSVSILSKPFITNPTVTALVSPSKNVFVSYCFYRFD